MDQKTETAPPPPKTLSATVYEDLRSRMIIGKLLPGDTISIRTLAAEHGMSAMPVREALKQLALEKALSGAAKRAYRVPDLTRNQAANLFQIRAVLEGGAAESAAQNLSPRDLDALRKWTRQMDAAWEARDASKFLAANFRFHSLIYSRAKNEELFDLIENLLVRTGPWLAQGILSLTSPDDWLGEHDAIIAALEARDAARARARIEEDARWGMTFFQG
ncbi:MAG: GntR family transcriptional regulator [Albidovulum sp.]|uniref:GntR family transcriptional regulator n=1 Tax=Albidovulum sp. TaxID=1872424 RepID=UPI003C839EB3